ncbi:2-oxoacid:acceptor oxidoreductase family protein [uncultured Propionivibrio sp.]|uniref:2-oxoacid:acceptor oxidoreductase family protein n=1 Tax=uncultured Propionivibrio sp. TaxID=426737 RepID=UPI0029C048CA|nr:2-oxoacid:acceptor oxidoreductase family protein [uncultured Propionivibrio sp.]
MHETVWLGRGGQGAFTAARLLGIAAMIDGKHAQAMPAFGPERRGAPVFAYTRIDAARVRERSAIRRADAAVILDASLLTQVPTGFLTPDTLLLIDAESAPEKALGASGRTVPFPARRIAREVLGSDHTNAILFGALAALTGIVSPASAEAAILGEFGHGSKGERNLEAFRHARALAESFDASVTRSSLTADGGRHG